MLVFYYWATSLGCVGYLNTRSAASRSSPTTLGGRRHLIFTGFRAHGPAGRARGPRDGVTAAFGVARHAEQVGGASWASSQFNGSTGLLWRCRLTPEIQAASDDNSSGLPSAQCCERAGVFRDSPAGAAAGRRRATGILVGGGTRARLHGAAAPRDPEYLDLLWVGSQAKRPRVRVQQTQGCVAAVPFFFRTSLHDLCDESPGAGRGPARPRAKTRRLSCG